MVDLADTVWRDFVTDGVAASGANKPVKSKIREWGTWLEGFAGAIAANGGYVYVDKATLDVSVTPPLHAMAWVIGDATVASNGVYRKAASGTATWTRVADLPYSFIKAADAGAGTANAIIATTSIPIPAADGAALIALNIFENNTGAATVAFNGGAALPIKTTSGADVLADYLVAGSIVAGYVTGGTFRIISDVGTAAAVAAAEAAAAAAAQSAIDAANAASVNFASRADAAASSLVTAPSYIRTAGYTAAGDGGGALYKKVAVEPTHAGKFSITLSGGGGTAWYEIAPVDSIDPIAIGAIADGVANDATALTNAATVAKHFGAPLSLRAGRTYLFTSVQNWGKLPGIIGRGTLKASGIVGDAIVIGGSVGAAKTLSSNRASKGTTLNINAHGISDEAMLWIRSGESCMTASAFGNRQLGDEPDSVRYTEFIQVQTVTDANNLALNGAVYYGYPATTTSVYVVDFLDQLVMKEFTWDNGGTGAINLDWCRNPTVERSVKCIGQTTIAPFWGEHILGGLIAPTVLRAANSDGTLDPSAYQGIKLRDGCQDTVVSPYVVNGEQGVDVTYTPSSPMNGTSRNVRVINGTFIGVNQQAITCHSGLEGLVIEGNLVEDGGDGISVRSPRCVIRNNKIYGRTISAGTGNEGIRIGNSYANSTIVEGNEVENFETGIIVLGNVAAQRRDEIIRANRVKNCRTGISVGTKLAATLLDYGLRITDNEIVDCLISGIVVEDNINGTVCNGNTVRQELRAALTTYGIRLGIGENLEAINNRGVDIGASVRVLYLAATAYGRFDNNMAVGTTMIADTQQGSTIELEVSIADDAVWSTVIVADVLKLEIISQQTPGNGMAWLRNGAVIHSIGPATFATATGVLIPAVMMIDRRHAPTASFRLT